MKNKYEINIIDEYKSGGDPREIAKKYNFRFNSIRKLLQRKKIWDPKRVYPNRGDIKSDPEIANKIINKYVIDKLSSEVIAEKLEISSTSVLRILAKNNIPLRSDSEGKTKYTKNTDLFKVIDNEEKAYFLGLLYADGSVDEASFCLRLTDRDILEKFSKIIFNLDKVEYIKLTDGGKPFYGVYVYSKEMRDDLVNLGCPQDKAFKIKFPNWLQEDLKRHFIRGFLDGDGCSTVTKFKPVIDFTSNFDFCTELKRFFQKKLKANIGNALQPNYHNLAANTRSFQITNGEDCKLILDFLYQDTDLYIYRKYENYKKCLLRSEEILQLIEKIPENYGTVAQAPFYLNLTKSVTSLSSAEKEAATEEIFTYFRKHKFPYPKYSELQIKEDWEKLTIYNNNNLISNNEIKDFTRIGSLIIKHFQPHFYHVAKLRSKSMVDAFNNDLLLKETIKNRLNNNYVLTGNMLRQGLRNSFAASAASFFPINAARLIYQLHAPDNGIVYDCSAGFGQRALAALSSGKNLTYVGAEPCSAIYLGNFNMCNWIKKLNPKFKMNCELHNQGSETFCPKQYF